MEAFVLRLLERTLQQGSSTCFHPQTHSLPLIQSAVGEGDPLPDRASEKGIPLGLLLRDFYSSAMR